jgi:Tol biopolymer transport system component
MRIDELEQAYQHLREQLMRGELDESDFKSQVDKLRFTDSHGTQWKMGWYTGKWYQEDDGQWVQGQPSQVAGLPIPPPAAGPPGGTEFVRRIDPATRRGKESDRRPSRSTCLVASIVALLIVASVLLIIAWQWGWWRAQPEGGTAVAGQVTTESTRGAATETSSPEATPTTVAKITETRTPKPTATATRQAPTATSIQQTSSPQPTASSLPTATMTETETPVATATQAPRATAQPSFAGQIYVPVYDANPDRRTYDIHMFQLGTGQREILVGQASQPDLSPDGKRLVYRSWDQGMRGIYVRELADGKTWQLVSFHEAEHPSWSPDSQYITYSSQQESDRKWRLYRTWGLESDMVRRDGGDIFGRVPIWSPDGRIIYWECPLGACGLYAIHPDGTNFTRITLSDQHTAPAASPDGNRIVFMSNASSTWEIYLTDATPPGGQPDPDPDRLTQNNARDGLPTWSPDGRWLAFVSDRDGAWAVWVMRPNGSGQNKLFDLGGQMEGEVAHVPSREQNGWTWESLAWAP